MTIQIQSGFFTGDIIILAILIVPFILSTWNIYTLIKYLIKHKDNKYYKLIEVLATGIGAFYLWIYLSISDIKFVNWDVQLYNSEKHSMIAPQTFLTICFLAGIAFIGYILLRFIPIEKQTPVLSALSISSIYLGIGLCILWCIQTCTDFYFILLPLNCIVILSKTIYTFIYEKNHQLQDGKISTKFRKLSVLLNKAINLPWLSLIFMLPLLGIIIIILTLFGQEPDSVIKAWTETADWTMSQKIAPQNISYDMHYLCTVAAGGHRKIVKPQRTGIRHGHRVVVNRQLCIANAFEQILEEKTPSFHKIVRKLYDKTGYPISKHIHSKFVADIIYFIMKPLEWFFLLFIYTFDPKPENRIAVQYPHSNIPKH